VGSQGQTGDDRPEPAPQRRVTEDDRFESRRAGRQPYGDKPTYGLVLGLTASWYGVPGALYLVWLLSLEGAHQLLVVRQLVASLPWLLAAVVASLAIAGLLRRLIVGWRALAISFAAAVIGAGVTTIAHSLTL
jgi:hypothetical protein